MGILIDSSILIGAERGRINLDAKIKGQEQEEFFLSAITASELLHGVWRAKEAAVRSKRAAYVEGLLSQFPVLAIDLSTARIHAQLWADLDSKGLLIGPHDMWIAAVSIAHGLTLVTSNDREFKRVPGLRVVIW